MITGCTEKKEKTTDVKVPSVKTEEVTYTANGTTLKGFYAYDENNDSLMPGVIVVHEWWGQNNYVRERAKMLAELGYAALAIDMYGEGKLVDHPGDAQKMVMMVMKDLKKAQGRFEAGINYLKKQPDVDSTKIAAIGYCFGGGIVLNMALAGSDLDGAASFHGSLPTNPVRYPDSINARLLILNGENDKFITKEQIDMFKKEMDKANIQYEFINYPGAIHSFTNPKSDSLGKKFNLPLAYNKEADEKSWEKLKEFFNKIF
jgi:dienelactone hydrolase